MLEYVQLSPKLVRIFNLFQVPGSGISSKTLNVKALLICFKRQEDIVPLEG